MKKKRTLPRKRQKTDRMNFRKIHSVMEKLGLHERSPEYQIRHGWIPPKSKRIPETYDQVTFSKKINGYEIVVHTSFNPTIKKYQGKKVNGAFAKKGGSLWVHINDPKIENPKERSIVTRVRYRVSIDLFLKEVTCFVMGLKKRPMHPNNHSKMFLFDPSASRHSRNVDKFVQWFREERIKIYDILWVSDNLSPIEGQGFSLSLTDDLAKFFDSLTTKRRHYQKVERKKRGIKKSQTANVLRKEWDGFDKPRPLHC